MIYLDYNSTTPIAEEVYKAMQPYFEVNFANPSSSYMLGVKAKEAVCQSRKQIASLIAAKPEELFFTGTGSEANNTVLKGVAHSNKFKGKHIVASTIEHPSIMEPLDYLKSHGLKITYVPVNSEGLISVSDVEKALQEDTILVTIMHSNNEVGTLQPISEIGQLCKERNILLHTDASQSIGKVAINVNDLQVDFLTIAGHKLYAPKGIGALYLRNGLSVSPLIHGAKQENGLRAGTENVPYIVGLGKAAELAQIQLDFDAFFAMKKYFYNSLKEVFNDIIHVNGNFDNSLPNTLNVSFLGYSGAEILADIPEVLASTGSACHSNSKCVSPVLTAMGATSEEVSGAIRFSTGRYTTREEIDQTVDLLKRFLH